jgi:hypothetical protein
MYSDLQFNGYPYAVIVGSPREKLMKKALHCQSLGLYDQAIHWHLEGIKAKGCAIEHAHGVIRG